MYFNDVNIGYYIIISVLGLIVGEFVNWMDKRLPDYKKVIGKGTFKEYMADFNPNYILMILTAIIYIALLYKFGIKSGFIENLDLIKYMILTPMLLTVFTIDYRLTIIPNRLSLTMFEIGLAFAFLYGLSNVAITINMLLGMLVGGGIFLAITLLGGLFYGKEAMGLGDVKLMGALGLYFGMIGIAVISVLSFAIGGIISIIILIARKNREDGYIPFGPFIVLATTTAMFVPIDTLYDLLMKIFSIGLL